MSNRKNKNSFVLTTLFALFLNGCYSITGRACDGDTIFGEDYPGPFPGLQEAVHLNEFASSGGGIGPGIAFFILVFSSPDIVVSTAVDFLLLPIDVFRVKSDAPGEHK